MCSAVFVSFRRALGVLASYKPGFRCEQHRQTHTFTYTIYKYPCTHIPAHIYTHITNIYSYTYIHMHAYTYIQAHTYTPAHTNTYTHIDTCIHIYIYILT